ncbi:MAG TPA: DinB family protein [Pyrinomonadaceae bacterium]|nr:DinB family protein [Pyrinomonadaceae bacterium]
MSSHPETANLSSLVAEAERIRDEAGARFGQLSGAQLNWKPSPEEWSIAQCFDHLILTNRPYFPVFEKIASGQHKTKLWERVPVLPGLFGRLVLGAVRPESARKVKARKGFQPAASDVDGQIISRFAQHQDELVSLMKATEPREIDRIIITSAISPVVVYSLLDGYRILVTHERRHFQQAERVTSAAEFPQA